MASIIKFIYFDLGGVFFHWKHFPQYMSQRFGNTPEKWQAVFDKYDNLACIGKITSSGLWQNFQKDLGFLADPDLDFIDIWSDYYIPIPETADFVVEISAKYKIGLITDIYQGMFNKCLSKKIIPDINYFSIVQSCLLGARKPQKEIFDYALSQSGYQLEEILFIDDSPINTQAALKLGWNTVLFDEENPQKSITEIKSRLS